MKKFLFIFFIFMLYPSLVSYSQFEYYKPDTIIIHHRAGEIIVSASPNILFNTPNGIQMAGGIKLQVFISKRFSLDADLVFGRDYIHAGPGLIGLPLGLIAWSNLFVNDGTLFGNDEGTLTDFLFSLAAVALSFEHISYHVPMKNNIDISPFLSLLRYKSAYEYGNYSDPDFIGEQLSFASGIQINKYFGKFLLSPYAEFNIGYKDHIPGYNFGVYCGINFAGKRP
jgi:hypothetical protein